VLEWVRPHRIDGHGEAWRSLLAEEEQIKEWVEQDLTVVKITDPHRGDAAALRRLVASERPP
jgi:hypothetical protein